ncbi:antibiotic biosynthesis monooxygenase [Streptomyces sp. NBC_00285]|uniref:antibiotic biosynthesis monooxygenase family protein n=1 Tax=Streptomyces sp. NBC_00285 TaxID=2975700 RepID=UPI002E2C192A|nr:antibiotic biosynthesis monooxygenase family protein [Streptomyces sp. NBC_00285]
MITFVNRFEVHGSVEEFERAFDATSVFFSARPGFLGHRMLRHADQPGRYVNVAEWESRERFEEALAHPEFPPHAKALRVLATSDPNLYTTVLDRTAPR